MIDRETFVLLGGGPSLTAEDVEYVRDKARVIAINDAYRMAPWAFALYAADKKWIDWHDGVPGFQGLKYTIESSDTASRVRWQVLRNTGYEGLETTTGAVRTGFNGGYQALNLAVHFGAKRIVLLGFDMTLGEDGRGHWFGEHPIPTVSPYPQMREAFNTLVAPLAALGIEVVNCSRRTALTAFPCADLRQTLLAVAA